MLVAMVREKLSRGSSLSLSRDQGREIRKNDRVRFLMGGEGEEAGQGGKSTKDIFLGL